jgi:hypothetical protein
MNADCESTLCIDNACVRIEEVAFVSEDGVLNPMCSKDMPCQTIGQALGVSRKYIKVTGRIDAATTINGDQFGSNTLAIYGEPGMSTLTRSLDGSVLRIEKGADVSLFDIAITGSSANSVGLEIRDSGTKVAVTRVSFHDHKGSTGTGIVVMAGALTMKDSKVFQNPVGVSVMGTAAIEHSWVYGNTGTAAIASVAGSMVTIGSSVIAGNSGTYALSIAGTYSIKNNIISGNGNPSATTAGVLLTSTTGAFEFNTVSDNATIGADLGVSCAVAGVKISNSILTGNALLGCDVTYSLADTAITGTGNEVGIPMFIKLVEPLDPTFYRISSGSDARDSADPAAMEAKDIDGQARADGRRDMGADEYN